MGHVNHVLGSLLRGTFGTGTDFDRDLFPNSDGSVLVVGCAKGIDSSWKAGSMKTGNGLRR